MCLIGVFGSYDCHLSCGGMSDSHGGVGVVCTKECCATALPMVKHSRTSTIRDVEIAAGYLK
jgi:hypothetical protein